MATRRREDRAAVAGLRRGPRLPDQRRLGGRRPVAGRGRTALRAVRRRPGAHLHQPHAPGRRRRAGRHRRTPAPHRGRHRRPGARDRGWSRLGVLGARWVMEEDFYVGRLASHGLDRRRPRPGRTATEVDRVIFDELTQGRVEESSRATYAAIIGRLRDAGSEAVVLGCTEIELLVRPEDSRSRSWTRCAPTRRPRWRPRSATACWSSQPQRPSAIATRAAIALGESAVTIGPMSSAPGPVMTVLTVTSAPPTTRHDVVDADRRSPISSRSR